jgi:hypothetical protein
LSYKYYGGETPFLSSPDGSPDGKLKGYYSGKITQSFWDTLNIKLEQIKYKQLDSSYENSVDDQSLEIFIHYDNKVKHIKAQSASLPENVASVFYYIANSYKVIKPKSTKDTFKFESTTQGPLPIPDIKQVKFPPPN